jgi:hypothetical protein
MNHEYPDEQKDSALENYGHSEFFDYILYV